MCLTAHLKLTNLFGFIGSNQQHVLCSLVSFKVVNNVLLPSDSGGHLWHEWPHITLARRVKLCILI